MPKIKVANPVIELDGDEMTRIIWNRYATRITIPNGISILSTTISRN